MAIPIALKTFVRIVFSLQAQKRRELGVAGQDLLARGVAMIGEVVAAAAHDAMSIRPPKALAERALPAGCVVV